MKVSSIQQFRCARTLNVVWYYILARLLLGFAVLVYMLLSVRFDANFEFPAVCRFIHWECVCPHGTMAFFLRNMVRNHGLFGYSSLWMHCSFRCCSVQDQIITIPLYSCCHLIFWRRCHWAGARDVLMVYFS